MSSIKAGAINIHITRLVEEFLPMLIGMEYYFGISPQQYLEHLALPNKREVIQALVVGGYAQGDETSWTLSKSIANTVSNRLCKIGAMPSNFGYSASLSQSNTNTAPPPPIKALVAQYRGFMKKVPREFQGTKTPNTFMLFRRLCKEFKPELVHGKMKDFFQVAQHTKKYDLEAYRWYLRDLVKNGKA